MKWTRLITAPDQIVAEMWRDALIERGVPAVIRAGDTTSFLGVSAYPCRLLVDEDSLQESRRILSEDMGVQIE